MGCLKFVGCSGRRRRIGKWCTSQEEVRWEKMMLITCVLGSFCWFERIFEEFFSKFS